MGEGEGEGEGIDGVVKLMMLLMAQRESAICQCQYRVLGARRVTVDEGYWRKLLNTM